MHLLVRESHSLEETETAQDLGQSPAELVFLSFADSELAAAASAWTAIAAPKPSLRLANLGRLRHPFSVDLYLEQVAAQARAVLVRILGGLEYWRYGAEELAVLCRARGIALALLPGDPANQGEAPEDPRLGALSTIAEPHLAKLAAYLRAGGPTNLAHALQLLAHCAGLAPAPLAPPVPLPAFGILSAPALSAHTRTAVILFYRSHLLAGDTAPIAALAQALAAQGFACWQVFIHSLKDPAAARFLQSFFAAARPKVILNATGFSARNEDAASPLDAADVPVLQVVLAGSSRAAWAASARGLGAADLAMQVVLPELDGRLLTTAVSFKAEAESFAALEFTRRAHQPEPAGIALAARRACGWARLAETRRADRRVAVILPSYPGAGGQEGYAVGLDTFASLAVILESLAEAGYQVGPFAAAALASLLCQAPPQPVLSAAEYERLLAGLPASLQQDLRRAWGDPASDPAFRNGWFCFRLARFGNILAAIQPERSTADMRKAAYHDPSLPPCHGYLAFFLWLRQVWGAHALIPLGAHGTLEWLPGKAVALSETCWPAVLTDGLAVIYPFIVNNPGEAAMAKRRLGAVVLGHLTPPLIAAGLSGPAADIARLIEEYAEAAGLDRRRAALLRREILAKAEAAGLTAEAGAAQAADEEEALARLDAYLCDLKDIQIRDGLHVFGRAPGAAQQAALLAALGTAAPHLPQADVQARLLACPAAEREALLTALDGRFIPPGPAGAPSRGRPDVLPTGRNLFSVDPRALPTPAAFALAERSAEALLRRYLQDHGEWPRHLVLDLWGSATMRTGGEDFALALVLLGIRPLWDAGSSRLNGFEVLPTAMLKRPRVDVTLRISGLFRDAFPSQIALFQQAVAAVAARADEAEEWNPLAAAVHGCEEAARTEALRRIYGPAPGSYGAGVTPLTDTGAWSTRGELGASYLAASCYAYGAAMEGQGDAEGFAARVKNAAAFVHIQDHAESDLLESTDYAAHAGGFAAASLLLAQGAALYHLDTSRPETPQSRQLAEEIARIVRARAANPRWIAGQMRHSFRGAAEIARTIEGLFVFAATLPVRFDRQFELLFDATLGNAEVDGFLARENPAARRAMAKRFAEAIDRGLWQVRRNALAEELAEILKP
jgi:cobaltochelatase CobN